MSKILIIDDEPLVRRSLSRVLLAHQYQVFEAENGLEGKKIWQEQKPDLIFLDVLMPSMSGPELLRAMPDRFGAKIILISAYTGEHQIDQIKQFAVDRFLPKPFDDIFKIVEVVKELLP